DRADMKLKPEHAKFAGYFNVDNGTGAIRGVYLQGNEAAAPVFLAWMQPFKNLGMTTLAIRNTGGTDHLSYDAVGLPGFQFIQDEIEYNTRTHHSNMDVYERIQPNDMMRNAVIVATFVYHTANRDEKLPRKPLPKPLPPAERILNGQQQQIRTRREQRLEEHVAHDGVVRGGEEIDAAREPLNGRQCDHLAPLVLARLLPPDRERLGIVRAGRRDRWRRVL